MTDPISFFPNSGVQAAFGDIDVVEYDLVGYRLAGIQSVVNVMGGQYAENKHYRETTVETEYSTEFETEESQETSRMESNSETLRSATQSTASQSSEFNANVSAKVSYGVAKISAGVGYSRTNAKSQSRNDAKGFARQIVDTASESVRRRVSSAQTERRMVKETEEQTRGLDNKDGDPAAMIFRYLEEDWQYKLVQHGKQMFFTYKVTKPSANYQNALQERAAGHQAASEQYVPLEFLDPTTNTKRVLTPANIAPANWFQLAALFEVIDPILPPTRKIKTVCFSDEDWDDGRAPFVQKISVQVPEGYTARSAKMASELSVWGDPPGDRSWKETGIGLTIGGQKIVHKGWLSDHFNAGPFPLDLDPTIDSLEIGLVAHFQNYGAISLELLCEPQQETMDLWKLQFFQQLVDAHSGRHRSSPAEQFDLISVADISGSPTAAQGMIRGQMEALFIQAFCGTNLNGIGGVDRESVQFPEYPILDHAKLNDLQPVLTFLSQAFDFDKMSYRFLPHYLGDAEQRSKAFTGGTNGILDEFMKAGAVDLLVPVNKGSEFQTLNFMHTGLIMEGNDIPLPLDPDILALYEEIVEAREMDEDVEPIELDRWTKYLPTTQVFLQADATLPDLADGGHDSGPITGNKISGSKGE